jgi:threonine dehydrogenase-like Zn-dependent dehydrogenase
MNNIPQNYKTAANKLPDRILTWRLYGAGLENLGKEGKPEQYPMPAFGPDQLLLRIDAVGICFSDIKVINQGSEHPRLVGRDLKTDPVTLGHETAATVVGVGDTLKDRFSVGQRYVIQPDVFFGGKSMAFGYALPGAQTQYQVVGREILEGDEGSYLMPIQDATGYAEAALAEPWACVVASYRITRRSAIKESGAMWFIGTPDDRDDCTLDMDITSRLVIVSDVSPRLHDELRAMASAGKFELIEGPSFRIVDVNEIAAKYGMFDDIVILGSNADAVEQAATVLGKYGVMAILSDEDLGRSVKIDVGKVHYMDHAYVGATTDRLSDAYKSLRAQSEVKPGGSAWFIGAGGPMGQMHVQRAVELENGPKKILATDVDTARLESVRQRFAPIAERRGVELKVVNPKELSAEAFDSILKDFTEGAGFDDIVVLAPVAALIEQAVAYMGSESLMNIFAGVPIGTIASLDISAVYSRSVRFVGSSGSKVTDMRDTLHATESGALSTNTSVAAIGGIDATWEGMKAVKEGRFPGRVVIYPQIEHLPLTGVPDLKSAHPKVYALLADGMFWTRAAEAELLREMMKYE